ncbi:AI-2E family transporter [Megasphaera coli]|uniref:AI-2E family transporter n=1 Tax=Colibacter massiliensis TaxID=1852379 RepID=UPI00094EFD3D|nr:AI-2E family transporter [Colibacter massiliensis]
MATNKKIEFWLRVVLSALAVCLFFAVQAVYWPVIISLIITFILAPLRDGIQRGLESCLHRHVPKDISILLSFVVLIGILVIMTNSIVKPLIGQLNLLANNFGTIVERTYDLVILLESDRTPFYIPDQVKAIINETFVKISNYGIDGVTNLVKSVFAIAGTVVEFFVVPFITFYFMKDGSKMLTSFIDLYPENYRNHLYTYFREVHRVLSRYIRGQLLMSCIIATLTFLGMWLMNVPYPLVIALIAAVTEWIPIIGPIVGAVPAILLGAAVSTALALKVLVFYVVIQQLDGHFIMPQVMGKVISIHPVVIVIALLIGGTLLGVAGMILTVPLVAVLQVTCRHLWFFSAYRERMLKENGKD